MDYDNSTIILAKINGDCDEICQDLKKSADSDFEEMDKKAAIIFQNEEEKAGKTVIKLNDLSKQFMTLHMNMVHKATAAGVNKLNADFQAKIKDSGLDESTKKELSKASNDAANKSPTHFKASVESAVKVQQASKDEVRKSVSKRKLAFKSGINKARNGIKKYGSAASMAKASRAAGTGIRAIAKLSQVTKPNGDIDEMKLAGGILDVVDCIATFLPAPASIITGSSYITYFSL